MADEVPFDIPDSWEWVRFGNIVANYDSKRRPVTKEQRKNEHGYYDYYGATGAIDRVDDYIFEGEYLMIGEDGGNFFTERDNAFIASGRFWANNHVHIVQPILCDIHFLKHFLDSCNLPKMGLINGIAVPKLNQEHLNSILVPLPPLSEQEAIVAELSKYAPLLDEYQLAYSEIKLLNDSFPERLKKSILQEAVQGKLVPQDPSDEPAEALLERIRAEKQRLIKEGKIKKDKHESVIFRRDNSHYEKRDSEEVCIDEEIPFEIPSGWSWSRLGTCLDVRDGTHDTPRYVSEGVPLVTSKNLSNGRIDFSTAKLISKQDSDAINQRSKVDSGDIMYAMIGSIGNPVLYRGADEFSIKNMALFKCVPDGMYMEYVYWFLVLAQEDMKKAASGGVQSFVSLGYLRNYLIPVPPIVEQKRICYAIEQVLPLLAAL